jgi:hypothetical protein
VEGRCCRRDVDAVTRTQDTDRHSTGHFIVFVAIFCVVGPSPSLATSISASVINALSFIWQGFFVASVVGGSGPVHTLVPAIENLHAQSSRIERFWHRIEDLCTLGAGWRHDVRLRQYRESIAQGCACTIKIDKSRTLIAA